LQKVLRVKGERGNDEKYYEGLGNQKRLYKGDESQDWESQWPEIVTRFIFLCNRPTKCVGCHHAWTLITNRAFFSSCNVVVLVLSTVERDKRVTRVTRGERGTRGTREDRAKASKATIRNRQRIWCELLQNFPVSIPNKSLNIFHSDKHITQS
jgi:hypothetical protein